MSDQGSDVQNSILPVRPVYHMLRLNSGKIEFCTSEPVLGAVR
jgi:hypothetical protein